MGQLLLVNEIRAIVCPRNISTALINLEINPCCRAGGWTRSARSVDFTTGRPTGTFSSSSRLTLTWDEQPPRAWLSRVPAPRVASASGARQLDWLLGAQNVETPLQGRQYQYLHFPVEKYNLRLRSQRAFHSVIQLVQRVVVFRTSLVVQWLGVCLPMLQTRV